MIPVTIGVQSNEQKRLMGHRKRRRTYEILATIHSVKKTGTVSKKERKNAYKRILAKEGGRGGAAVENLECTLHQRKQQMTRLTLFDKIASRT
mmetsp:Transcript_958/g.1463  ORF Transcript_958/g.1463 Transcript_958/m.1463 type:complete len:93 (+) Transcript_958:89-367(+)